MIPSWDGSSLNHIGTLFPISNPSISNLLSLPIPLPAKKSTKLGADGFMWAFPQLEGGVSKGDFGEWETDRCCNARPDPIHFSIDSKPRSS